MDPRSAAEIYKTSTVENAPPIKVIRLLYEGAIRFLENAIAHAGVRDGVCTDHLDRAGKIVTELRLALKPQEGDDEMCEELDRLYLFAEDKIFEAMNEQEVAPMREAQRVLCTLLDAWRHIERGTDGAVAEA